MQQKKSCALLKKIWNHEPRKKMPKFTLAQILVAWTAAYGEDMNEEYPGFIQILSEEEK